MESLQGQFLVASPHLIDPNFFRTVVLMIKHDAEGAFGLVLNRPTQNALSDIWQMLDPQAQAVTEGTVRLGGPVAGPLVALHASKPLSEARVLKGVYFSAHKDKLEKIVRLKKKSFFVFSGYSGWAAGQLEGELEAGGWLMLPATAALVFRAGDDLWETVVAQIVDEIVAPAVKDPLQPPHPSLN